uniref:Uncharacterized protein n=1 Tax=Entomoneis paludosa TaxID=265537 RepID=A0A7S3DTP3_9STRA
MNFNVIWSHRRLSSQTTQLHFPCGLSKCCKKGSGLLCLGWERLSRRNRAGSREEESVLGLIGLSQTCSVKLPQFRKIMIAHVSLLKRRKVVHDDANLLTIECGARGNFD